VLLVGDAAGLAHARSGEGIRPAVESALLAANAIVAARGDYRGERLAAYDEALARRYGARSAAGGAGALLPAGLKRALAQRLLRREWFVRHVVLDRWFLQRGRSAALRGPINVQAPRQPARPEPARD
jgi:hypothetical protein